MTTPKFNVGDQVRYRKHKEYGYNNHPWIIDQVVKITESGMMRLADGTLWYHNGAGQGKDFKGSRLELWNDELAAQEARRNCINYITGFYNDLQKVTSEDLLQIMGILRKYDKKAVAE